MKTYNKSTLYKSRFKWVLHEVTMEQQIYLLQQELNETGNLLTKLEKHQRDNKIEKTNLKQKSIFY